MAEESLLPADTNIMPFDTTQNDAAAIDQLARDPDTIDLTQSLLQSGATGDPEIDTSLGALGVIQSVTAAGGGTKEIGDALLGQSPAMRQAAQEALLAASGARQTTPAQLIASAVLQIAPLLAGGALGGTEGALAGVQAGTAGRSAFEGLLDEDFESKQKAQRELALSDLAQATRAEEIGLQSLLGATQAKEAEERQIAGEQRRLGQQKSMEIFRRDLEAQQAAPALALATEMISNGLTIDQLGDEQKEILKSNPEAFALARDVDRTIQSQRLAQEGRQQDREKLLLERRSTAIPNLRGTPDAQGNVRIPNNEDLKELLPLRSETIRINTLTDELIKSISQGGDSLTGSAARRTASLMAELMRIHKERFGGGASFTESEIKMVEEFRPTMLGKGQGLLSWWKSRVKSFDPIQKLKDVRGITNRHYRDMAAGRGFEALEFNPTFAGPQAENFENFNPFSIKNQLKLQATGLEQRERAELADLQRRAR